MLVEADFLDCLEVKRKWKLGMMNIKDDDYIFKQATRLNDPEAKAILPSNTGTKLPTKRQKWGGFSNIRKWDQKWAFSHCVHFLFKNPIQIIQTGVLKNVSVLTYLEKGFYSIPVLFMEHLM